MVLSHGGWGFSPMESMELPQAPGGSLVGALSSIGIVAGADPGPGSMPGEMHGNQKLPVDDRPANVAD